MELANQILSALSAYGLKPEGVGKWRCKSSPFRMGSDSNSFTVSMDGDKLVWHDHVDNRGGGMFDLARALGIELPRTQANATKRRYSSMDEYAKAHGVPEQALKAAMWRWTEYKGRPALEFPTAGGKRWRFMDGDQPYYISERGYKPCWYGLAHDATRKAISTKMPIVICNGEISTVAAHYHGVPALCMTSGEKSAIPADLLDELKREVPKDVEIVIALDCDDKGRKSANGIAGQLMLHWHKVRAVDLLMSKGGDLADFCALNQGDSYFKLLMLPSIPISQTRINGLPEHLILARVGEAVFIHAKDVYKLPPIEWIVPGEIPHRGLTVLYGPSGAGKSFVAIDYCLRIAQQSPVVYIAGEGESGLPARIRAWCVYHAKPEGKLILGLGAINFIDAGEIEILIENMRVHQPKLLVVDTLARSMADADENMTRDMNVFMSRCKHLMNELDCALMLVHHTGKSGAEYRGSSALRGAADSMIAVEDEDDVIRVESRKTKDSKPFDPRYVKLHPVDTGLANADGNPIYMPVAIETQVNDQNELSELTIKQRRVLEVANNPAFSDTGIRFSEIMELVNGISRPTLMRILGRLKKAGYIEQEARREAYNITDKGRQIFGDVALYADVALVSDSSASDDIDESVNQKTSATNATSAYNKNHNGNKSWFGGKKKSHYDYEN